MPDFKLIRTWVRFPGRSRKDTYHYLTLEGQKQALAVPATRDQGIFNELEGCYCYSFHFQFHPEMFEDGKVPHNLQPLFEIAQRRVREEYVADREAINHQWSNAVPGQYIDQGKVEP